MGRCRAQQAHLPQHRAALDPGAWPALLRQAAVLTFCGCKSSAAGSPKCVPPTSATVRGRGCRQPQQRPAEACVADTGTAAAAAHFEAGPEERPKADAAQPAAAQATGATAASPAPAPAEGEALAAPSEHGSLPQTWLEEEVGLAAPEEGEAGYTLPEDETISEASVGLLDLSPARRSRSRMHTLPAPTSEADGDEPVRHCSTHSFLTRGPTWGYLGEAPMCPTLSGDEPGRLKSSPQVQVAHLEDSLRDCEQQLQDLEARASALSQPSGACSAAQPSAVALAQALRADFLDLGQQIEGLAAEALESGCGRMPGAMDVFEGANRALERVANFLQHSEEVTVPEEEVRAEEPGECIAQEMGAEMQGRAPNGGTAAQSPQPPPALDGPCLAAGSGEQRSAGVPGALQVLPPPISLQPINALC